MYLASYVFAHCFACFGGNKQPYIVDNHACHIHLHIARSPIAQKDMGMKQKDWYGGLFVELATRRYI